MQYRDPISGRKRRKTTNTSSVRKAERLAGDWEKKIRDGKDWTRGRMAWSDFRRMYEENRLEGLAVKTAQKSTSVLNMLDEIMSPRKLKDVNAATLDEYQAKLRKLKRSEHTIKGHLAHIRSALSWAYQKGWIASIPKMPKIQRAKTLKVMKGRAITTEEFERMMLAVGKIIVVPNKGRARARKDRGPDAARVPSWQNLIRGLWLSGLRLSEALELHWSDETKIRVDTSLRHPMLRVPSESEKGNEDRILPMAPEFAVWLEQIPENQRRGFVFNPIGQNKDHGRLTVQTVGRTITAIGERAGIKVDTRTKRTKDSDPETVPVELMRHKSINTTMMFYVGSNAEKTAGILWEAYRKLEISQTSRQEIRSDATLYQ